MQVEEAGISKLILNLNRKALVSTLWSVVIHALQLQQLWQYSNEASHLSLSLFYARWKQWIKHLKTRRQYSSTLFAKAKTRLQVIKTQYHSHNQPIKVNFRSKSTLKSHLYILHSCIILQIPFRVDLRMSVHMCKHFSKDTEDYSLKFLIFLIRLVLCVQSLQFFIGCSNLTF